MIGIPFWSGEEGATIPASLVLLLHGDGTDGQTTTVDSSSYNSTVTASGVAELSTDQAKFGTSSLLCPATGSASWVVTYTDTTNQGFDSSDFTVEFFFYKSSSGGSTFCNLLAYKGGNNITATWLSFLFGDLVSSNRMSWWIKFSGSAWALKLDSGSGYTTNAWHFIRGTRSGDTFSLFVDDMTTAKATGTLSGSIDNPNGGTYTVNLFDGVIGNQWLDEIRFQKGVVETGGVPVSAFSPP